MSFRKIETLISLTKGKKPLNILQNIEDSYLPYVDIKAFETGIVDNYTDGEKCVSCNEGDLLIVCDGSRSGLVGKAITGYVGSTLARIDVSDEIDINYLYYFIQGKYQILNTNVKGTGTPHLKQDLLKSFNIYLPPIEKQKLIVAKIEELFSKLDKGVEELNKIKEQLKIYRQAVLKEAFKSDMEYKPLGDISFSRLGKMLDKNKNRGEYRPYLRNINVRWMNFDLCELLYMKIEESELEKYTATKGDLLMCEGGEPGRCAVWNMDYDICYQKAIHRIRFNKNTNPKFYMYYFYYMAQTGELSKYFTGMGIKHLTGESLKKVPVPILDIDDQQSILKCIEQRLSVCEKIEQTVNESLQKAESLRQSILKQAFEGKLV